MNRTRNRYVSLGLALMAGGGLFALIAWLVIGYMPLTALGLSGVILGFVSFSLGRSLPRMSPEAGEVLMEAGLDTIAALIEELGVKSRAIYLPRSMTHGVARALVPLHQNSATSAIKGPLERRLLVRLNGKSEEMGILLATPGSRVLALHEVLPASSVTDVEAALSSFLVGTLDLVERVRLSRSGESLRVELEGPALAPRFHPTYAILGSPMASIAAAITAEVLGRPLSVASESTGGKRLILELRLHDQVEL